MILAIDITKDKKAIAIFWPKKIKKALFGQSNKIDPLTKIDQLLRENHLSKKDIRCLVVNRGPGSFTGIRIGISIANTWANFFRVPILGVAQKNLDILRLAKYGFAHRKKANIQIIQPFYGREPNISFKAKNSKS
jgi:tRNA threonylcarbamoyladenosine biosynthesis protein TsaB